MAKLTDTIKALQLELKQDRSFLDNLKIWWMYNKPSAPDWYYALRNYMRNLLLFNRLAWRWKCWDSHYTIDVFTELLEQNAKCCRKGLNVKSEQIYRRGMTAAGLINRAYTYSVCNDKAYVYLSRKYPCKIIRHKLDLHSGASEKTKRLIDKMSKRIDATEARMKKEAWEYVHKYIGHVWD